jgi:hypothetical protein
MSTSEELNWRKGRKGKFNTIKSKNMSERWRELPSTLNFIAPRAYEITALKIFRIDSKTITRTVYGKKWRFLPNSLGVILSSLDLMTTETRSLSLKFTLSGWKILHSSPPEVNLSRLSRRTFPGLFIHRKIHLLIHA